MSINGIGEGSDSSSSVDGMEYTVSDDAGHSCNAFHWGAQRFREHNDPLSRTASRSNDVKTRGLGLNLEAGQGLGSNSTDSHGTGTSRNSGGNSNSNATTPTGASSASR